MEQNMASATSTKSEDMRRKGFSIDNLLGVDHSQGDDTMMLQHQHMKTESSDLAEESGNDVLIIGTCKES